MHVQKTSIFILETFLGVVRALALDVGNRISNLRLTNRKSPIAILPSKFMKLWKCCGDPFGGFAFDSLYCIAKRYGRRETKQDMDVVIHSSNL